MKNYGLIFLFSIVSWICVGQETWNQLTDFPGSFWWQSVSFPIGNKGYVGTGTSNPSMIHNAFWEYNPASDQWRIRSAVPMKLQEAVGFSIGNYGYIGTGEFVPGDSSTNRFFEYDVAANKWTEKASFPGLPRKHAFGFSLNNKGYIGGGDGGTDVWEYDPVSDAWTKKESVPVTQIRGAITFTINDKAYIGLGVDDNGYSKVFFEYDPALDIWIQKQDFPGQGRWEAIAFSISGYGYVGSGLNPSDLKDFWRYNPLLDEWIQLGSLPGEARYDAIAFVINGKGYFGLGANEKDFYEFSDNLVLDTIFTFLDISVCYGEAYEGYDQTGMYTDTFHLPGVDSIRILTLTVLPQIETNYYTWICPGDTLEGHTVTSPSGHNSFRDTFPSSSGCDSIRFLLINALQACDTFATWDLDSCEAYMSNGSHMDYSEFEPEFTEVELGNFICIEEGTGGLFRAMPQENKHSCTPGVHGTKAMCVSVADTCDYAAGHPASVVAEIRFNRVSDIGIITDLEFYTKAPPTFNWIDGDSGLNNYPQRYGIRILNNGEEVFRKDDFATTPDWTLQKIDLIRLEPIMVAITTVLRIEWFPYCPVGNGAAVSVWDLDEIQISIGCATFEGPLPVISGIIRTPDDRPIDNVLVFLSGNEQFTTADTMHSDQNGYFTSGPGRSAGTYYLKAQKNEHYLEGVTILDLLDVQKHLLGLQPFTSVYQYIAADIDRNNVVNSLDLLEIRKLLLGIYSELPRNTSWKMGILPADYIGTDVNDWKETVDIDYNGVETTQVEWIGVKVGDVSAY